MAKMLSILICSLEQRRISLDKLLNILKPQLTGDVEIHINSDNRQKPTGIKRNELMDIASGEYICYIDDDDEVAENYVSSILNAIKMSPDCCGIEGIITFNGQSPRKFIHSIKHRTWYEKDGVYYRCPNHLNPIKREIALKVKFPEVTIGEDQIYSNGVLPLLKEEVYIDNPIYFYLSGARPPGSRVNIPMRQSQPIRQMPAAINKRNPLIRRNRNSA